MKKIMTLIMMLFLVGFAHGQIKVYATVTKSDNTYPTCGNTARINITGLYNNTYPGFPSDFFDVYLKRWNGQIYQDYDARFSIASYVWASIPNPSNFQTTASFINIPNGNYQIVVRFPSLLQPADFIYNTTISYANTCSAPYVMDNIPSDYKCNNGQIVLSNGEVKSGLSPGSHPIYGTYLCGCGNVPYDLGNYKVGEKTCPPPTITNIQPTSSPYCTDGKVTMSNGDTYEGLAPGDQLINGSYACGCENLLYSYTPFIGTGVCSNYSFTLSSDCSGGSIIINTISQPPACVQYYLASVVDNDGNTILTTTVYPNQLPHKTIVNQSGHFRVYLDAKGFPGNSATCTSMNEIDIGPCSTIYEGDLTLSSQAEVNAFCYTEVTGTLIISGVDITDLTPLLSLTSLGSNLGISDCELLTNLNGLQGLTTVIHSIGIWRNNSLTSLIGLQNLTSVGGGLGFYYNNALTNLDGLQNITLLGALEFWGNSKLTNLDALQNLASIPGHLNFSNNSMLTNLDALQHLTSVGGPIEFWNNGSLNSFCGLYPLISGGYTGGYSVYGNTVNPSQQEIIDGGPCPKIYNGDLTLASQAEVNAFHYTEVTGMLIINGADITDLTPLSCLTYVGSFRINNNNALTNLNGLQNLKTVKYSLGIHENGSLTSLVGLQNLTTVGGGLGFYDNNALTSLDGFQNLTSVGGALEIWGNELLTNLYGLQNLTSLGWYFNLTNTALTNLDELRNLNTVGGWLEFWGNTALTNLDGLENLNALNGADIHSNSVLTRFCGLYPVISERGFTGNYSVYGNAVNPAQQEIIDGGPCNSNQVILGNTEVYNLANAAYSRRAMPFTFSEDGNIQSISIYHNGGTGNVLLGVYADNSGSPGSLLGVTPSIAVNDAEGWQKVSLSSPVSVISGQKVWLAWVFQKNVGVRFTPGAPSRAQSIETWSAGMPASFGVSTIGTNKFSIFCTYTKDITPPETTKDLGNTEVYTLVNEAPWRRAMPVTFIEEGNIQSISIYHNGGTGNMLLGVFTDNGGFPGSLLRVTPSIGVNGTEGWQKVSLTSPVHVFSGETVWLSWVFRNGVKVRFTSGTPSRAQSGETWAAGMPASFGVSTIGTNKFSIYCTYTTEVPQALPAPESKSAEIATAITPDVELADLKVYPNPFSDRLRFEFISPESVNARIDLYDMTGRMVKTIFKQTIEKGVNYEAEFEPNSMINGMYFYRVIMGNNITNGKVVYIKE